MRLQSYSDATRDTWERAAGRARAATEGRADLEVDATKTAIAAIDGDLWLKDCDRVDLLADDFLGCRWT